MKPGQTLAAIAKTAQKKSTGEKVAAKTLLDDASKALAAMIKAARADNGLDPKTPKNKPFWKSTQLITKSLKMAKTGLAAKSNDFFKGIAEARQAEEQMKVDWELTDSKNKQVIENGKKLGYAIALLRTDLSKEAARKKKGGELTAKEKAEFDKIKAQQKELLAKIAKLEAGAKKDKALEKGLREMKKQADHIVKEPVTLDAFIATLYLLDVQVGLIRGYEYFLCKVAGRPDWWVILMFIPLVNFIIWIILCIDVAKSFGKGAGFGIGLLLLPIIFFPILGFGSAQYQGPSASPRIAVSPPPQPA